MLPQKEGVDSFFQDEFKSYSNRLIVLFGFEWTPGSPWGCSFALVDQAARFAGEL